MSPTNYRSPTAPHFPQHSPTFTASHAHPQNRRSSIPQSPVRSHLESPVLAHNNYSYMPHTNGSTDRHSSQGTLDEEFIHPHPPLAETPKAARTKDPMSFASILSSNAQDAPKSISKPNMTPRKSRSSSNAPNGDSKGSAALSRRVIHNEDDVSLESWDFHTPKKRATPLRQATHEKAASRIAAIPEQSDEFQASKRRTARAEADTLMPVKPFNSRSKGPMSDKENEKVKKEIAKIDAMDLSDIESSEWQDAKQRYVLSSQKRQHDVEATEDTKRKVRSLILCLSQFS